MIWPDSTLVSIYKAYPRQENRKAALLRIGEALDRICAGEIDSKPRTPEEAVEWLRARTNEAAVDYGSRERRWIPHPSTFYHQSKYLRTTVREELPENLGLCVGILSSYPLMPTADHISKDVKPFLAVLVVIEKAIKEFGAGPLLEKVCRYSHCVSRWPVEDRQYVPSAKRWFSESRYLQSEQQWTRKGTSTNWQAEREQVRRVLD